MAKHFKYSDNAPETVYLAPCGDSWDGATIVRGYEEGSTLTRVFTTYEDALDYVKSCGWLCLEDTIIKISVGRL